MANIENLLRQILQARYGEEVRGSIHDAIEQINEDVGSAVESSNFAVESSTQAVNDSLDAKGQAQAALNNSKTALSNSTKAMGDAETALNNSFEAATDADDAAANAAAAAKSAQAAQTSAAAAQKSSEKAATDAAAAQASASSVQTDAAESATKAGEHEQQAHEWEKLAESYAHGKSKARDDEEVDNAEYYYEQTKLLTQTMNGSLIPMGSVTFEELESKEKEVGYMYNITTEFTTTDEFEVGAGYSYDPGANVYWTGNNKWAILAPVLNGAENLPAEDNEHLFQEDDRVSLTTQDVLDEIIHRLFSIGENGTITGPIQDSDSEFILSSSSEDIEGTSIIPGIVEFSDIEKRITSLEKIVNSLYVIVSNNHAHWIRDSF